MRDDTRSRGTRHRPWRKMRLMLALGALAGLGQSASADVYRSWSYVTQPEGDFLMDNHFWVEPSEQLGSSAVAYDPGNFAKSMIGITSEGWVEGKIAVSATDPEVGRVFSQSYYLDPGWVCSAGKCATAVPMGGSYTGHVSQDGSLTLGSANFNLIYSLGNSSLRYDFFFEVEQGEGELQPSGGLWRTTDAGYSLTPLVLGRDAEGNWIFDPMFHMVWEDDNHDGVFNFSYDVSFVGTTEVDLTEELSIAAYVHGGAGPDTQFFDSYSSFHAAIIPEPGVEFTSDSGRRVGHADASTPVPEPNSLSLLSLAVGLLGTGVVRRARGLDAGPRALGWAGRGGVPGSHRMPELQAPSSLPGRKPHSAVG